MSAAGNRYAILRDLDTPGLYPFGVLFEQDTGAAKLHTFSKPPGWFGLRQDYDSFDEAIGALHRSFLVSALSTESAHTRPTPESSSRVLGPPTPEEDAGE